MFSSLQQVDLVVTEEDRTIAVQTDARTRAQMEEMLDVSVVFAIARALNPIRAASCDGVRFAFVHDPPERLRQAIAAAGSALEVVSLGEIVPAAPRDDAGLTRIAGEALRALGSRILAAYGLDADEAAIELLSAIYAERVGEDGGRDRWVSVVELAAGVGEVLCRRFGLQWAIDPGFCAMVPMLLVDGDAMTNVFGKIERFLREGASEAPSGLYRLLSDADRISDGPVMFDLRPRSWGAQSQALVLGPLIEGPPEADIPLITLVRDMPSAVATLPADLPEDEIEPLLAEAGANLRRNTAEITAIETPMPVLVVHGSYYASEMILVPPFMGELSERLSSRLLLAAMPTKGELWVTSALTTADQVAAFTSLVARRLEELSARQRLSSELFLVSDGRLVSVARAR